ncbi:hypothetical protein EC973_000010 [Apophysomyces ossiformis]|uniref:Uncharacterized protein n=1 Tax=Apophysomyces ossiformis TaxID=679940 RepID=A0A8H7BZT2_9FUNG|nr:hypothetical protein EC973_000010 [Apophysomyces ossiformis]
MVTLATMTMADDGINNSEIGCKCIITAPTKNNTDSTYCLCVNKADGTKNDTEECEHLIDNVFRFCTNNFETTSEWNTCVRSHCPCHDGEK